MITNSGRTVIRDFFGGRVSSIATSVSLGLSNAAESATSTAMGAEALILPVSSIISDTVNGKAVYKADLLPSSIYTVYEMGLFREDVIRQNRTISIVGDTVWTSATIVAGPGRFSNNIVRVSFSANGTTNAETLGLGENLSEFLTTDYLTMSFTGHANLSSFRVRLGHDANNYYTFTVLTPAAGYNNVRVPLSDGVATGTPSWSNITYMALRPSGSAAGSGSVDVDRIGVEQSPANVNSILVARRVLPTPITTDQFISSEIEYSLGVTA